MTIEQFITETNSVKQTDRFNTTLRPRIICNDGFSMSVQASQYAYCIPKIGILSNSSRLIDQPSHRQSLS